MTVQRHLVSASRTFRTNPSSPLLHTLNTHTHTLRATWSFSVALSVAPVSCQTMKTLRRSFYGVTGAFCLTMKHMHSTISNYVFFFFFLSDGCQTHRWCTFFCARSNSVYSTTRCSGSQCLHVCPWWEDNVSGWICAPVGRKHRGWSRHNVPRPFLPSTVVVCCFFAEIPRGIRQKSNTMPLVQ